MTSLQHTTLPRNSSRYDSNDLSHTVITIARQLVTIYAVQAGLQLHWIDFPIQL